MGRLRWMCLGLAVAVSLAAGEPAVSIQASPRIAFADVDVTLRITVPPHADNRRLVVEMEGDALSRTSGCDLDGADAPRTTWIVWRDLPAGEYVIAVRAYGSRGPRGDATTDIVRLAR